MRPSQGEWGFRPDKNWFAKALHYISRSYALTGSTISVDESRIAGEFCTKKESILPSFEVHGMRKS